MKGRVKIKFEEDNFTLKLNLYLKIEDEWFYSHKKTIFNLHDEKYTSISFSKIKIDTDKFYKDIIQYLSDINNIKKSGEELMKEIVKNKTPVGEIIDYEKEIKKMIKEIGKSIEIQIKD